MWGLRETKFQGLVAARKGDFLGFHFLEGVYHINQTFGSDVVVCVVFSVVPRHLSNCAQCMYDRTTDLSLNNRVK